MSGGNEAKYDPKQSSKLAVLDYRCVAYISILRYVVTVFPHINPDRTRSCGQLHIEEGGSLYRTSSCLNRRFSPPPIKGQDPIFQDPRESKGRVVKMQLVVGFIVEVFTCLTQ